MRTTPLLSYDRTALSRPVVFPELVHHQDPFADGGEDGSFYTIGENFADANHAVCLFTDIGLAITMPVGQLAMDADSFAVLFANSPDGRFATFILRRYSNSEAAAIGALLSFAELHGFRITPEAVSYLRTKPVFAALECEMSSFPTRHTDPSNGPERCDVCGGDGFDPVGADDRPGSPVNCRACNGSGIEGWVLGPVPAAETASMECEDEIPFCSLCGVNLPAGIGIPLCFDCRSVLQAEARYNREAREQALDAAEGEGRR